MDVNRVPIRRPRSEQGVLLLTVAFFVLILGGLSASALYGGLAERTASRHRETAAKALEIAETGIVEAMLELRILADADGDGLGVVAGGIDDGVYATTAVQDEDLPDRWEVRARGESGLSVRRVAVGLRRRRAGAWLEGVFARTDLVTNGGIATDSYDSRLGTWDEQAINEDGAGRFARTNGHIGSNLGINLNGTATHVRGNAIPGPGSTTEFAGQPYVGDTIPRTHELELLPPPEDDFLAAYAAPDNLGMLVRVDDGDGINGDDAELQAPTSLRKIGYDENRLSLGAKGSTHIVLPGGTYFFTDLVLGGQAVLEIAGPSEIYVTGDLDLSGGGLVNASGVPSDCRIFAHPYAIPTGHDPSRSSVTLTGGSGMAAALYAPYRDVVLTGGGDFFGSLIADTLTVNGDANVHYDEALGDIDIINEASIERLYWREVGLAPR